MRSSTRTLLIAAASNFSTAYNLVVINIVQVIVQNQYCGGNRCKTPVTVASTSCLVGAICGQLMFGYVGDCLGRAVALQLTMALSILGAFVSAFAVPLSASRIAAYSASQLKATRVEWPRCWFLRDMTSCSRLAPMHSGSSGSSSRPRRIRMYSATAMA